MDYALGVSSLLDLPGATIATWPCSAMTWAQPVRLYPFLSGLKIEVESRSLLVLQPEPLSLGFPYSSPRASLVPKFSPSASRKDLDFSLEARGALSGIRFEDVLVLLLLKR